MQVELGTRLKSPAARRLQDDDRDRTPTKAPTKSTASINLGAGVNLGAGINLGGELPLSVVLSAGATSCKTPDGAAATP